MHAARIAGLQDRLARLAQKRQTTRADFLPALEADVIATRAALDALVGIDASMAALALEAPQIAADEDARAEFRRRLRERIQYTLGQGPDGPTPEGV